MSGQKPPPCPRRVDRLVGRRVRCGSLTFRSPNRFQFADRPPADCCSFSFRVLLRPTINSPDSAQTKFVFVSVSRSNGRAAYNRATDNQRDDQFGESRSAAFESAGSGIEAVDLRLRERNNQIGIKHANHNCQMVHGSPNTTRSTPTGRRESTRRPQRRSTTRNESMRA